MDSNLAAAEAIAFATSVTASVLPGPAASAAERTEGIMELAPPPPPSEPDPKRSRSGSPSSFVEPSGFAFATPGEDGPMLQFVPRGQTAVTVRHGSSLDLLSKSHVCLNEEFNDTDPEKDFKKWLKKGAQPYFLAVIEPSTVMSCCLRCLLDGDWDSVVEGGAGGGTGCGAAEVANTETVGTRRLVVDYVTTLDQFQGRGYAGHLLGLVLNAAAAAGANSYVLALEDSCVYWMSKGFVLDDGPINRRLNVFPDTHLLKLPSNLQEDPACIPPEKAEGDESSDDEDEDAEDDEKTGDEGEEVQNRAQVGMHPLHQHLLSLSDKTAKWTCDGCCGRSTRKLQRFHCSEGCDFDLCECCWDDGMLSGNKHADGNAGLGDDGLDPELAAALVASVQFAPGAAAVASQPPVSSSASTSRAAPIQSMEDDDEALLQQAILRSLGGAADALYSEPSSAFPGDLVANAQVSQYSFAGGRSACTIIATIAAADVLGGTDQVFNEENVIQWVTRGVKCYGHIASSQTNGQEHTGLDDIWSHESLKPVVENLERGPLINGAVGRAAFQSMIRDAREWVRGNTLPASRGFEVALVITKPPETVMLALCHGGLESIIFDSHNRPMRGFEGAYAVRFNGDIDAAAGLCALFPAVSGMEDFGFAGEMMNQFDATPLRLTTHMSHSSSTVGSGETLEPQLNEQVEAEDEDEALARAIEMSMHSSQGS